jgi:hypothetical protein
VRVLPCETRAGVLDSHESDEIRDLAVSDVGPVRQLPAYVMHRLAKLVGTLCRDEHIVATTAMSKGHVVKVRSDRYLDMRCETSFKQKSNHVIVSIGACLESLPSERSRVACGRPTSSS